MVDSDQPEQPLMLEEQLDRAYRGAHECVHYVAELRRWAAVEPAEWYGIESDDNANPESLVSFLKESYVLASNSVPAVYDLYPLRDNGVAVAGVRATNYHTAAVTLARKVLQAVAKAIDSRLFDGLNPETRSIEVKIPGLDSPLESFVIDEQTGRAIPTGNKYLASLRKSDFRERLQAMPELDEEDFAVSIMTEHEYARRSLAKQAVGRDRDGSRSGATSEGDKSEALSEEQRKVRFEALKPAERKAYWAYKYVVGKLGTVEDRKAHEYLKENGIEGEALGELENYKPPSLDAFRHDLSQARKATDESKYTRRRGRPTGKSVASEGEVE
jgi:hypothetical protein